MGYLLHASRPKILWLLMARMAVGGRRLAQRGCLGAPSGRCQAQRRCFLFPVSPSVSERPRKPVLATGHQRLNEDSTTTDSGHLHEVNTPIALITFLQGHFCEMSADCW